MNDKTYKLMVSKMHEVTIVPPQSLGPFTFIYKKVVPYLKFSPWKTTAIISFVGAAFLFLFLGPRFVKFISILQFGF